MHRFLRILPACSCLPDCWIHPHRSSLSETVDPSFRALSGRLKFTVRRHKFNKDSLSAPTHDSTRTTAPTHAYHETIANFLQLYAPCSDAKTAAFRNMFYRNPRSSTIKRRSHLRRRSRACGAAHAASPQVCNRSSPSPERVGISCRISTCPREGGSDSPCLAAARAAASERLAALAAAPEATSDLLSFRPLATQVRRSNQGACLIVMEFS